jgi:hypothetical protein
MRAFCSFVRSVIGLPEPIERPYQYRRTKVRAKVQTALLIFNKDLKFHRFYQVHELAVLSNGMLMVNLGRRAPYDEPPDDAMENEFEATDELVLATEEAMPHSIRVQIADCLSKVLEQKVSASDIDLRFDYVTHGGPKWSEDRHACDRPGDIHLPTLCTGPQMQEKNATA